MSEVKHTPGPWSFDSEDGVYKEWPSGQLDMIAEIGPTYATTPLTDRANGRLIAAAPDLLQAGEQVVELIEHLIATGYMPAGDWATLQALKAAIAKAHA